VAYYRLMLPALAGDPVGSHRGGWQAALVLLQRLREREVEGSPSMMRRLAELGVDVETLRSARERAAARDVEADVTATLQEVEVRLRRAGDTGPLSTPVQRRTEAAWSARKSIPHRGRRQSR